MKASAPPASPDGCAAFDLHGPDIPASPVILSIPHAGREYPADLLARARVSASVLQRLEDRHVDLLAQPLIARGHNILVARTPRAMIDLNRHEREIDPAMVAGMPREWPLHSSVKLRGGLGLMPRRLSGVGDLWRRPVGWDDVQGWIATVHRPYHAALTALMLAAREAHGHAILVDLHSMPPLPPALDGRTPAIVVGDRFGRSASDRLAQMVVDAAGGIGIVAARNSPYAGDHLLDRHGRPDRGLHAIQIEIDRRLYLDDAMEEPGPGLDRIRALIVTIVDALSRALPRAEYPMAAE
ncbi:N-formylglutamate amidohydrolase [Sphingobium fontiphilum]|uniref:N-formylglutamate amidohydrolase n=1 Tax=Sphingobium fontiphilum TaxID=944425 RepID=A0A7W6GNK4_9SPHN|nr:N-formylglutamate amidohydrolase [Sphingobium fontiphilum]MBB3981920.1 N-formylglutamate amidohydrolase [Sphingobium fontiphilum]